MTEPSSNDITFIERSAGAAAFALPRQIGVRGAYNNGENFHIAGGVFNDNAGTQSTDDEAFSASARIAGLPYQNDKNLIHLGASASYRKPDQANDRFDFDSRAENRLQTPDSVSSVINDGNHAVVTGLEAAFVTGPFSAQGEYVMANIDNQGGQDPSYNGAYGQVAYTLTGESRPYSIKKGAFGGIKPDRPLNPSNGDWGAWEIAARYSHLDLNDNGLNGGKMNNITLGTNWYLNNYMRLMGNVTFVDTDKNAVAPDDDPTIFLMRITSEVLSNNRAVLTQLFHQIDNFLRGDIQFIIINSTQYQCRAEPPILIFGIRSNGNVRVVILYERQTIGNQAFGQISRN